MENVITRFKNPLETMNTKITIREPWEILLAVKPDIYYIDQSWTECLMYTLKKNVYYQK